jgi:hypothetical protein
MKKALLLSALASLAISWPSANATVFNISFNGGPLGYSGSGDFDAKEFAPAEYIVTGVYDGSVTDPGFGTSNIVAISSYAGADDALFYPNGGNYFDNNGLSFRLANGVNINLFNFVAGGTLFRSALESNPNGDIPEFVEETVYEVTPEPSSIILLGTSALAGTGFFRRRRSA